MSTFGKNIRLGIYKCKILYLRRHKWLHLVRNKDMETKYMEYLSVLQYSKVFGKAVTEEELDSEIKRCKKNRIYKRYIKWCPCCFKYFF